MSNKKKNNSSPASSGASPPPPPPVQAPAPSLVLRVWEFLKRRQVAALVALGFSILFSWCEWGTDLDIAFDADASKRGLLDDLVKGNPGEFRVTNSGKLAA